MNAQVQQSVINQALLEQVLKQVSGGDQLSDDTMSVYGEMDYNIELTGDFCVRFDEGIEDYCLEHVEIDMVKLIDEDGNTLFTTQLPSGYCEWELAKLAFSVKDEVDPVHAFEDLSPRLQAQVLRAGA